MEHTIPPLVKKILSVRGHKTEKSVRDFLYNSISNLSEPFSIPHLNQACNVLKNAIFKKEKIFVYGDGDTDGICASFLILNLLEMVGANFSFRLTHRLDDEYEIEESLVQELYENGYSLLISVDCGISSHRALKKSKDCGIKVIVLDHHIGDISKLVDSHIYINPWMKHKWPDGTENLSGAGIVYKFVEGMKILISGVKDERVSDFIELVSLSIISDSLPLTGENRILVKEGLRRIPFTTIKGLAYLMEQQCLKNSPDIKDVAMRIIPLINSPGRFGKPEVALNLLMEKDDRYINKIVNEIAQMDRKRYATVTKAMNNLKEKELKSGFIILKNISPGMCGIIASKLTGKYNRPFLVGCLLNDYVKGSIRAPVNYNLHQHLKPAGRYMMSLGGHKEAMGFKCHIKNIPKIKNLWSKIKWDDLKELTYYDCVLDIKELNPSIIEEVFDYLKPFGKGNPEPIFLCKDTNFKKVSVKNSKDNGIFWLTKNDAIYETILDEHKDDIPPDIKKADVLYTPHLRKQNNFYRILLKVRKIYSF